MKEKEPQKYFFFENFFKSPFGTLGQQLATVQKAQKKKPTAANSKRRRTSWLETLEECTVLVI